MLSKMHFRTGFDARDVEFVLGGDGWRGVKPFILDFNQVMLPPPQSHTFTYVKIDEALGQNALGSFQNDPTTRGRLCPTNFT